jgi:L-threonylcarbamoyladenylate synthase
LICHYPHANAAFTDVLANTQAQRLAASFWPGPLTLVLPQKPNCEVSLLASAGLDTLAVRVPASDVALTLLRAIGRPVAAPSANLSGQVSPTMQRHVMEELSGRIAAVLDCGTCPIGVESTVLDLTGATPTLLRPGGATVEAIEAVIGPLYSGDDSQSVVRSPGLLGSHYAPKLPVRLHAVDVEDEEALLAFGRPLPGASLVYCLSRKADLTEAAARLFAGLRQLDAGAAALGLTQIAVMSVPDRGLGRAINDRLRRAATPRT